MDSKPTPAAAAPRFADTRWSIVAGMQSESGAAVRRSLAELCQSYWYPVFAYVRRCGHQPEVAYDLTQAFFEVLMVELRRSNPQEFGQFRAFLLAHLSRFLAEDWRSERTSEESAEVPAPQPLDELEQRQREEVAPGTTPERAFQKSFALEVLARALHRLRGEARTGGRIEMFDLLEPSLTSEPEPGRYEALADQLGTRPLAVVVAIKRLRQRFRELVDAELGDTVVSASDLETERATLLAILAASR